MTWEDVINGLDVGGRATDFEQIALTLMMEIGVSYPNGEPAHITQRLAALAEKLKSAETALMDFAKFMIEEGKAKVGDDAD